jgi:polysaccharide transporter, PST family
MVLQSSGQAGRYLRLGVGIATVTVGMMVMGLRWGPLGVAVGYSLAKYILLYPTLKYAFSATPIHVSDYFAAVAIPASASTVAAGVAMLIVGYISVDSDVVYLAVGGVAFVSAYLATFVLLPTGRLELSSYVAYLRHFKPQRAGVA